MSEYRKIRGSRILPTLLAGCVFVLWHAPSQAAMYAAGASFATTNQSMWAPGPAGILDFNLFIGPTWNVPPFTLGGIQRDVSTPAFTVIPEVCAWGVCTPAVTVPAVNLGDYGAELRGETDGRIGFDLNLDADSGSVNVAYPVDVTLTFPDKAARGPTGNPFTISSDFSPDAGGTELSTNFPDASLTVDFVFDVAAQLEAEACVINCGILPIFDIDANVTLRLVDIDPSNPLVLTLPSPLDVITVAAALPDLNTVDNTPDALNKLFSEGTGAPPLLDVEVDLDLIATTALGLPPLSFSQSLLGAGVSATLLDVLIGAELKVVQEFTFDPMLMATLEFSDGQSQIFEVGSDAIFNVPSDDVTVTPTFFLANLFTSQMFLRVDPTFDLELLAAALMADFPGVVNALGVPDINLMFGPLFEIHEFLEGPRVSVFNDSWALPFDPVVTSAFFIEVPEPGTVLMLAIGLLGVAGFRGRRTWTREIPH